MRSIGRKSNHEAQKGRRPSAAAMAAGTIVVVAIATGIGLAAYGYGTNDTTSPSTSSSNQDSSKGSPDTSSESSNGAENVQAPASSGGFPTRGSAGLPAGWQPARQVTGDYWIRQAGTVIEDVRFTDGTIYVDAPNVTLRRIHAVGAIIVNDYDNVCKNGLLIEDSSFVPSGPTSDAHGQVIGPGGYTARNVLIDGVPEALRVSGKSYGCTAVHIENSFIRIAAPDACGDWHGDGIQGYDGPPLVVRQTTLLMEERPGCYGTAPFFYPSGQGNTSVDIDGLIVSGGGYSFRNGMPGSVKNLHVLEDWGYGAVDVNCSVLSTWQAQVATLSAAGQPVPVRPIQCSGVGN